MVTASVHNRFKNKATMNESYIERYIQAKRRNEVIPKCLFGAPSEVESERFLFEQGDLEVASENKRVLDKYDLTDVPTNVLAEFQISGSPEPEHESLSTSNSEVGEGFKFQPRIITEDNPPPRENLFSPIDKIEFTPSSRMKEAETTGKCLATVAYFQRPNLFILDCFNTISDSCQTGMMEKKN